MGNCYTGKVLRINLTDHTSKVEELNMDYARQYIGGRGLGTRMLLDEINPSIDPLSVENKLIIATGPMTGVNIPTGTRYMIVTKAPLNNMIASSNSGGIWGAKLKYSGYDVMIIEGKSETPVYLEMRDGQVEFKDASHLWGKETLEVEASLKGEDKNASVMSIGQAGENLSLMAAIMNEGDRAAARSGVGAVFGSKNLKAIVISAANNDVETADTENFNEFSKKTAKRLKKNIFTGNAVPAFGTAILVNVMNDIGSFPYKNWQEGYCKDYEKVNGEALAERLVKKSFCHRCTIGCGRVIEHKGQNIGGPEYETLWGFGSNMDNDDLDAVLEANHLCNEYGLDTISTSGTIACAMELYEKGYITEEDCDGYPIEFGNARSMVKWIERIGKGEGKLGKLMAQGSYALASHYGVPELSMSVKKLELPAYDPRGVQGMGLGYATNNRGGCHVRGNTVKVEVIGMPKGVDREITEGKADLVIHAQDTTALLDSMGLCLFLTFAFEFKDLYEIYTQATGFDVSEEEFRTTGERIYNLERFFNQKAGMKAEDDTLPSRLLKEPLMNAYSNNLVNKLDEMLPEYYQLRGWENAFPTEATLKRLGIK